VIEGFKVLFADMAGLRESVDPIEAEGVRRARAWADAADLRLWVIDQAAPADLMEAVHPGDLLVLNKADLPMGPDAGLPALETLRVSAKTEAGMDALWSALSARVKALIGGDFPAVTRLRHRRHLQDAAEALRRGQAALARSPELGAEDLRHAAQALGRIAGRIDPEQVLDEVFSSFCIGK
jgi:tRNA modification GTPase